MDENSAQIVQFTRNSLEIVAQQATQNKAGPQDSMHQSHRSKFFS